jgi:4-deoxy-L-threo-5-hexosulose-uronate ketol-isomerase
MDTQALRETFLVDDLFVPSELRLVVTDMDRMTLGGVMPSEIVPLPSPREFGTSYFTERRELGIVNLGAVGHVWVGDKRYSLGLHDFLYVGAGNHYVAFEPCGGSQPCFYFLSCPAHRSLPVVRIGRDEVAGELIGDSSSASCRTLRKYIHPDGVASCQLVMGLTELTSGSVWNTMPPHTHSRRSEVYLYSGLADGIAIHLMGQPETTRHLVVRDREAVLSPAWSLHTGVGTRSYSFVWGMAGENQAFTDMDRVEIERLR